MLTGLPPFYCRDRNQLFEKIRKGVLEFPDTLSDNARDILQRLLTRDPNQRLGCGPTDAAEIKNHPFFAGTPWKELVELKVPSPWVPTVASSLDTSQFDAEFTNMPLVSPSSLAQPPIDPAQLGAAARFEGFTYIAPHNMTPAVRSMQQQYQQQAAAVGSVGGMHDGLVSGGSVGHGQDIAAAYAQQAALIQQQMQRAQQAAWQQQQAAAAAHAQQQMAFAFGTGGAGALHAGQGMVQPQGFVVPAQSWAQGGRMDVDS